MFDFKVFLKSLLPPGSLWRPLTGIRKCPNPEFEDGDMEDTTVDAWTAGNSAGLSKITYLVHSGVRSMRLQPTTEPDPYFAQTSLTVGCRYRVSGWYITQAEAGSPSPQIINGDSNVIWTGTPPLTEEWTKFEIDFSASDPMIGFQVVGSPGGAVSAFYDDITIETIQTPDPEAHYDLFLEYQGDVLSNVYEFLKDLAYIRNPYRTPWLRDLEKEYGIVTDTSLTDGERRSQLAAVIFAKRGSGSLSDLQNLLNVAGFAVEIKGNDPPINPLLSGLSEVELIVNNDGYDDSNYGEGLTNNQRWQKLFWICESSEGWPYEYGDIIHTLKNDGSLLLYNDYLTHLLRDYSKYRNESLVRKNTEFLPFGGLSFYSNGYIKIPKSDRFNRTSGSFVFYVNWSLSIATGTRLFSKRSASETSLEVFWNGTGLTIEDENGTSTIVVIMPAGNVVIGINWEDGETPLLYLDGILVGSFSADLDIVDYDQDIFLGNRYDLHYGYTVNSFDAFLYFSKQLSTEEHLALADQIIDIIGSPEVSPYALTSTQKKVVKDLVTAFKPLSSWGLLASTDNIFQYSSNDDAELSPETGYGDGEGTTGGKYTDVPDSEV